MERSKEFVGRNMFYDKQNRLIYMDRRTEKMYVITNADVRALYILNNRVAIAVLASLVLYFYLGNLMQVAAITVIVFALLSVGYRKMLLPRLEVATGITKDEVHIPGTQNKPQGNLEPQTLGKMAMNTALSIAVSVLFYLNVKQTPDMEVLFKMFHYVLAIATMGYGIINGVFLINVMKSQKQQRIK